MKLRFIVTFIIVVIFPLLSGCQNKILPLSTTPLPSESPKSPLVQSLSTPDGLAVRSTQRVEIVIALQTASTTPLPTQLPQSAITLSPIKKYLLDNNNISEQQTKDLEKFDSPMNCGFSFGDFSSPNGNWFAYSCPDSSELLMINRSGTKAWLLNYAQLSNSGKTPENISVYHWSGNDNFIYLLAT